MCRPSSWQKNSSAQLPYGCCQTTLPTDSIPLPSVGQIYDAPIVSDRLVAVVTRPAEPGGQIHFYSEGRVVQRVDFPARSDGAILGGDFNHFPVGEGVLLAGSWPRSRSKSLWIVRTDSSLREAATLPEEWGPLLGVLGDTSLIVRTDAVRPPGRASYAYSIVHVPQETWIPRDALDAMADTLMTLEVPTNAETGRMPLWAHEPTFAVGEDRIWLTPTDAPEIIALSPRGEPVLRIQWDAGDRSIPPSALARWQAWRVARAESTHVDERRRAATIASVRSLKAADRYPSVLSLDLGGKDRLYVRRYTMSDGMPRPDSSLLVLDQDGTLVARLDIPITLRVAGFGHDYLLARISTTSGDYLIRYPIGPAHDPSN